MVAVVLEAELRSLVSASWLLILSFRVCCCAQLCLLSCCGLDALRSVSTPQAWMLSEGHITCSSHMEDKGREGLA